MAAVMNKPDAAIELIHNAVKAGIAADCVLMDTWFTNEPFINRVLEEGLQVIGMLAAPVSVPPVIILALWLYVPVIYRSL